MKAVSKATPEFCPNAPAELVSFHRTTSYGKDVLDRLLRDHQMDRAWAEIERQRQIPNGSKLAFSYLDLREAIFVALRRAHDAEKRRKAGAPPSHVEQRAHAQRAAQLASQLAEHIGKDEALDFLVCKLFPGDAERNITRHDVERGVARLASIGISDRSLNGAGVALAHTSFFELLVMFQKQALERGEVEPTVQRVRPNVKILTFCRILENCAVIGLTATPFTRGLGKHYQAIVNVATTDGLIETGNLVRPIVYAAVEMDASGVPVKSTGEWDERGLEREGIKIVGDVVTEYIKRTAERFGGPVKTICFSSTVAHGEEICRAFAQVGLNFQNISYHDDEDERRAKIAEFRKAGSLITGLVSCDALAKGFDVPDVKVCLLCRPLRKSLTTHIQQIGRVMRPAAGKREALVIDHTGNALRFLRDTVDFWANGIDKLDEGAEKDRVARTMEKKERAELVCSGCQAVLPPSCRVCPGCGRERPAKRSGITVVGGMTQEIDMRQVSGRKFDFGAHPILQDPALAYQTFLAFTAHRKRGDVDAARRWAAGLFKGVYGRFPPRAYDALSYRPELMTVDVESFCKREMARYSKRRVADAA